MSLDWASHAQLALCAVSHIRFMTNAGLDVAPSANTAGATLNVVNALGDGRVVSVEECLTA